MSFIYTHTDAKQGVVFFFTKKEEEKVLIRIEKHHFKLLHNRYYF